MLQRIIHVQMPRIVRLLLVGISIASMLLSLAHHQVAAVASIKATKTDALLTDADNSGNVSPGDTLRYTVTIQNTGNSDATNVVFNDTIDNNTAFVPGSLQTTPLARNDSYSTVGNVLLSVPAATGVLLNDSDPDGSGGLTVASFSAASANGGSVSVAANGSFTYNPPAGFSGTDTFSYTVNDGETNTNSATVSITVGQVVWFINNAASPGGDGRFTSPFNSIAAFSASTLDQPGDYIFVYQGSGSYSGVIALLNNQRLIGHGVGLSIAPNLSIAASSRPTIANLTLGSGNTVRGLNVSTNTGTGISGTSVGALTINNVSVTNTGGVGVSLSGGSAAMAVTFDSVSSSGGANGITLINNAGSFTDNGGTIDPTTGHGIAVSNTGVGPLNFTLKNSTVTGALAGFDGVSFDIATSGSFGTITIQSNSITNNGRTGVRANIRGTGSIAKIDIGSNTFTGNSSGIDLTADGTASLKFDIHNNPTISGTRTQVSILADDTTHNNGVGPTMEGYIRNNPSISSSPTGSVFIPVWVVSDGDGNITLDITNNTISNFGEEGIAVESRAGSGDVNARIANNSATTTASASLSGMVLRSGNGTPGETNLLCVNLSSNTMSRGAGAVADYYLDRAAATANVFQLQGLTPAPATPAQAEAYVVSTDSAPPATAFAENGTYTAATCATVSFASAAGPAMAQAAPAPVAVGGARVLAARQGHRAGAPATGEQARVLAGPITPVSLGTLNPGETVTLSFDVTIDAGFTGAQVSNQGNVTADGGINVLTDDPDTPAPNDSTVTLVVSLPTATPTRTPIPPGVQGPRAYLPLVRR